MSRTASRRPFRQRRGRGRRPAPRRASIEPAHRAVADHRTAPSCASRDQANRRRQAYPVFSGQHEQLVVMTLRPGEEIGMEIHQDTDQFLRVEKGEGKIVFDSNERPFAKDDAALVPAGTQHNVVNTSATKPMKLYTLHSPPKHADGTIHATKAEADAAEASTSRSPRAARNA